jgi:MATE family multidrug resistance protein
MDSSNTLQRKIWGIAWPAVLSNISLPLLGLVDTAILGHLDNTRYLGAVAIGAALLSFIYWGFGFLRMGTTGLVARAYGAGDSQRELQVLLQSAVLALGLATVVILFHPWWLGLGLSLMNPEESIEPLARSYASIRIYSAPAVLLTYAIVGWFIGRQDTRWPMIFVVTTNCLNIILDLLFVVVLDMKSDGAALATLVAEYVGCGLALAALLHKLEYRPDRQLWLSLGQPGQYRQLLRSNQFLFIRTICLLFSFAFFTSMSGRLGNNVLAANTILLNLLVLAAYAMDGFAYAVEALSGHAAGRRNLPEFFAAVRACSLWSVATSALISALYLISYPLLFPLFTDHGEVQVLLLTYRHWLFLMPLVAVASYLLDGVFIGTAMTRYMMHTMLFCLLVVYLPAWYLLQDWGNTGLWLAFTLFNGTRGVTLGACFYYLTRRGLWLGRN